MPRYTTDPAGSNLPTQEDNIQNLPKIVTPPTPEGVAGNADTAPPQIGPASMSEGGQTPSEHWTVDAGARPGWNSTHSHNTRFKSRLQANMSHALSSLLMQDNAITNLQFRTNLQPCFPTSNSNTPWRMEPATIYTLGLFKMMCYIMVRCCRPMADRILSKT
jgi:hypothetical protein